MLTAALQPQHSQHEEQEDEVGALLRMLTSAPGFAAEHELYSVNELRERIEKDMLEDEWCGVFRLTPRLPASALTETPQGRRGYRAVAVASRRA